MCIYIIYICTHIQRHYPYLLLLLLVSWHLSLVTSWPKEVASLMADCSNDASTATTFSGKFHELSDIIIGSPVWWEFSGETVDGWVEAAEAWWKFIFSKRFQKKSCPYEGIIGLEPFENLVSARLTLSCWKTSVPGDRQNPNMALWVTAKIHFDLLGLPINIERTSQIMQVFTGCACQEKTHCCPEVFWSWTSSTWCLEKNQLLVRL